MTMDLSRRTAIGGTLAAAAGALLAPASALTTGTHLLNRSLVFTQNKIVLELSADSQYTITAGDLRVKEGTSSNRTIIEQLPDGFYTLQLTEGQTSFIVAAHKLPKDAFWGACGNFSNQDAEHDPARLIPDLAKIGVCSLRETFLWEQVEPVEALGAYQHTQSYQQRNSLLEENGIELFYCASNTHRSYGPWRNLDSASTRDAYARHILQTLEANPHLTSVEIYNEPNNQHFNTGNRSGKNYATLLAHVYPIIKATRPDIEVIAGATAGEAFEFARDFFANGGGAYLDAWSFHPYGVSGRGIYDAAEEYLKMMREAGVEGKKLRASELGWSLTTPTNTTGNNSKSHSEADQAINLANAYAGAFAHQQIISAHWYNAATTRPAHIRSQETVEATEGSFGLFALPEETSIAPYAYEPREAAYGFYATRCALENLGAGESFRTDAQYRYPVFGSLLTGGSYLLATSGWLNGAISEAPFTKRIPLTAFPSATGNYWRATPFIGGASSYGYGGMVPSHRMPAIITISARAFNEGETYSVHGDIGRYYKGRGGQEFFGAPISAQEPVAGGWAQSFSKNRAIYWHSATGAREIWVTSPIGRRYLQDGGPKAYGFPTSSEAKTSYFAGGWEQTYQVPGGKSFSITRTPRATRAFVIDQSTYLGRYWAEHQKELGLPVEDASSHVGGLLQRFVTARGQIHTLAWSPATGAHPIYMAGAIGRYWQSAGGIEALGYPQYAEQPVYHSGGAQQAFKNPATGAETYLHYSDAHGVAALDAQGPICKQWLRSGGYSTWGYPVTSEQDQGKTVTATFSRGTATLTKATSKVHFTGK